MMTKGQLREEISAVAHELWMRWANHIRKNENITKERLKRWDRNCFKPYNELSEHEKDKDRMYADKILEVLKDYDIIKR